MSWKVLLRSLFLAAATLLFLGCLLAILATGPIVVRTERVEMDIEAAPDRLRRDVSRLCNEFTPRSYRHTGNLDRAAAWIEGEFRSV